MISRGNKAFEWFDGNEGQLVPEASSRAADGTVGVAVRQRCLHRRNRVGRRPKRKHDGLEVLHLHSDADRRFPHA